MQIPAAAHEDVTDSSAIIVTPPPPLCSHRHGGPGPTIGIQPQLLYFE